MLCDLVTKDTRLKVVVMFDADWLIDGNISGPNKLLKHLKVSCNPRPCSCSTNTVGPVHDFGDLVNWI